MASPLKRVGTRDLFDAPESASKQSKVGGVEGRTANAALVLPDWGCFASPEKTFSRSAAPPDVRLAHRMARGRNLSDNNAELIKQSRSITQTGSFTHNGVQYTATPIENASGQYCQLYRVEGPVPLIEGRDNAAIVLRVCKNIERPNQVLSMLKHQRENNIEVQLGGLPVLNILNFETMMSDGFLVVPFVPHSFDLTTPARVEAMRQFLETCYGYDLLADAHNGTSVRQYEDPNFRSATPDGPPILCDYMEEEHDDEGFYRFDMRLQQAVLPSWVRGDMNDPLVNELDPRILSLKWDHVPEALTPGTATTLLKEVSRLRKHHIGLVTTSQDIPVQARAFQEAVAAFRTQLGLDSIPLSTVRTLLRIKPYLKFIAVSHDSPLMQVKIRKEDGTVFTIWDHLRDKHQNRADLIDLISAGNGIINSFLVRETA